VNLDLSHPETFFFSARTAAAPAEVFLMRLILVIAAERQRWIARWKSRERAKKMVEKERQWQRANSCSGVRRGRMKSKVYLFNQEDEKD
jgi:hypothetical protein